MARKGKITVFGRFILMLLVVVPLSYFIASYVNGEDGLQNLKELPDKIISKTSESKTVTLTGTKYDDYSKSELIDELLELKEELEECESKKVSTDTTN